MLFENQKQLLVAVKLKSESDSRCLRLESDMALLAAKGSSAAQKAKEAAKDTVRGVKREMKQFELHKQKEVKQKVNQVQEEHGKEMKMLRGQLNELK